MRRRRAGRPPDAEVVWLAWTRINGRVRDLAADLGGVPVAVYPTLRDRELPVVARYALSAVATLAVLVRRRPAVVVVTNPPVVAALVGWVGARLVGARLLLDSHPGGFGLQGDRWSRRLQPLHRWLLSRAEAVLVATDALAAVVRRHGGRPLVVHESPALLGAGGTRGQAPAPLQAGVSIPGPVDPMPVSAGAGGTGRSPGQTSGPQRTAGDLSSTHPSGYCVDRPLRVVAVAIFAPDEPVEPLVDVPHLFPEHVDISITGAVELAPSALLDSDRVHLLGFLPQPQYQAALRRADVVVVLTNEEQSVPRAAYEAAYLGRPLVVTGGGERGRHFPHAFLVDNEAASIADALKSVLVLDDAERRALGQRNRDHALAAWAEQRRRLVDALATARSASVPA